MILTQPHGLSRMSKRRFCFYWTQNSNGPQPNGEIYEQQSQVRSKSSLLFPDADISNQLLVLNDKDSHNKIDQPLNNHSKPFVPTHTFGENNLISQTNKRLETCE